jgi:hypothetical protein
MKNSFTLSTEECTYFTNVSAEVLLVAECFVYFRMGLWTGKRPEAEKEHCLGKVDCQGLEKVYSFFLSENQSASQCS